MTKDDIDLILREGKSQDSDFEEPHYKVWYEEPHEMQPDVDGLRLAAERLPLFLARVLKRELGNRSCKAEIEVE